MTSGREYWRSLDEYADTPEFREFMYREFPAGASEMLDTADRRSFLKVMGASLALAGLTLSGCRRLPEQKIVPHASSPPDRTPGMPVHYATALERGGVGQPLLVTSYDGRPIKVDGNPDHPSMGGGSDLFTQASILDLYDPDRSRQVLRNGEPSTWDAFAEWARENITEMPAGGRGLAVLCEHSSSRSMAQMRSRFREKFPNALWYEYEPLHNDEEVRGSELAFGGNYRTHYHPKDAKVVVALDSDFLGLHPDMVRLTRQFAAARRVNDQSNIPCRMYSFESGLSVTGANADHRVPVASRDIAAVAARLAMEFLPEREQSQGLRDLADRAIESSVDSGELETVFRSLIADLGNHRGESIVMVGPRQPAEVQLLGHMLNAALGNVGRTVTYSAPAAGDTGAKFAESIKELTDQLDIGAVATLVVIGGNPVYNAPADLNFADKLTLADHVIHLSNYVDETSDKATWHLNRAHDLEAWGDTRSYDGHVLLTQPLIEPLFAGRSPVELLATLIGDEETSGHDIVRRTMRESYLGSDGFERKWRQALHRGFIDNGNLNAATPQPRSNIATDIQRLAERLAAESQGMELVFVPCYTVYDGRYANNGWLQELPDPISKLTWDNAVLLSPSKAKELGIRQSVRDRSSDMVEVSLPDGKTFQAVAVVQPGQHPQSMTISLGYGRRMNGRICPDSGFDCYAIRTSDTMSRVSGVSVRKVNKRYKIALTQDHHAIDTLAGQWTQRRLPSLVREANVDEYQQNRNFANERTFVPHRLSLWDENLPFHNRGANAHYAWGMTVDLNSCTGCNACVIACQAENNIPIVGKDQVLMQREMHWLRIDRYYRGEHEERPNTVAMLPVMCVHCENAPCEQVCPVAATVHDEDGMNVMVYNRCIGTRYCSNNCPYKVRRFNYFDYHRRDPLRQTRWLQVQPDYYRKPQAAAHPLQQLVFNPEVTIRVRGVMEKCTYCVQRVAQAKIKARNEWVKQDPETRPSTWRVPDGSLTTACAQACPAEAIVFGDLNDESSRVRELHKHHRAYEMLEELNTKPRTKYIAKVRNQIPELAVPPNAGGGH